MAPQGSRRAGTACIPAVSMKLVPQATRMLFAMPSNALPRRLRPGAVAVVLGLHLLALGWLLRLGAWADRGLPAVLPAPLQVWLLNEVPRPAAPKAAPQARPPPFRAAAAPAPQPQAITPEPLPQPPAPAAMPSPVRVPEPAATAAAPASAPLNLALPPGASAPWRQRSGALDDARSNTPRATLESRLAGAMGGNGEWVEERVDIDHVRFRRGNTCVNLQRSRAAQIDPMARNAGSLPWLTKGEEPC